MAKITLIGLNNFDGSIFDGLKIPAGVDKEVLKDTILLKSGEFELLYPDAAFTKQMIEHISKKWRRTFEKWVYALTLEYNPIENYDRLEEWTDELKGTSGATNHTVMHTKNNDTSDDFVTGYESNTLHQNSQSKVNGTSDDTSDGSSTGTNNTDSKHKGRVHGNIGVTTSDQMLTSHLETVKWNLYEHIADVYVSELCVMVY